MSIHLWTPPLVRHISSSVVVYFLTDNWADIHYFVVPYTHFSIMGGLTGGTV